MKRIAQVFASAALIVFGLTISAPAAKADTFQDYVLAWSGQAVADSSSFWYCPSCTPNSASATGTMTLDLTGFPTETVDPNPGNVDISSYITALSVTVSGSTDPAANGTFTLADLGNCCGAPTSWDTNNTTINMH